MGILVPLFIVAAVAAGIFYYHRRQNKDRSSEEEGIGLNSKSHGSGTVSHLHRRTGIGELFPGFGATLFPGSLLGPSSPS